MAEQRAGEGDYRQALMQAERALMHAAKHGASLPKQVGELVTAALSEVSRVLDIGRDESQEMTLT